MIFPDERIEYTPYGESWIEWKDYSENNYVTPFRFTSKEKDMETGLYYYGARYLDAKTSRWMSTDPALGEYIPGAGSDNSQLPGMGGVFNYVNMHLYHYAGNNPVRFTDPTGMFDQVDQYSGTVTYGDTLSQITEDYNYEYGTSYNVNDIAKENGISDPNKIYVGQNINFPGKIDPLEIAETAVGIADNALAIIGGAFAEAGKPIIPRSASGAISGLPIHTLDGIKNAGIASKLNKIGKIFLPLSVVLGGVDAVKYGMKTGSVGRGLFRFGNNITVSGFSYGFGAATTAALESSSLGLSTPVAVAGGIVVGTGVGMATDFGFKKLEGVIFK